MLPAQERLGTDGLARFIDLNLVIQTELPALKCGAQIDVKRGFGEHRSLHLRIEKAHRITPGCLGFIHRQVNLLHEFLDRIVRVTENRHADTGGSAVLRASQGEQDLKAREDTFPKRLGLCFSLKWIGAKIRQKHDEIVAAQAGYRVRRACAPGQALRDLNQHLVSEHVAQSVVDRLEIVDVNVKQCAKAAALSAVCQCELHAVEQQAPVGQIRQAVVVGQVMDALLRLPPLRDVLLHRHIVRDRAMRVAQRADDSHLGILAAVLAPVAKLPLPDSPGHK